VRPPELRAIPLIAQAASRKTGAALGDGVPGGADRA
jgi:hypothetical protein